MKIFLSYSSKDQEKAKEIYLALLGAGYDTFFDKNSLPPGADFHSLIRKSVAESDVFIFLISPNSVQKGSYALTELKLAKEKWQKPWGAVLPVMIDPTDFNLIDRYLAAITILEPEGGAFFLSLRLSGLCERLNQACGRFWLGGSGFLSGHALGGLGGAAFRGRKVPKRK